MSRQVMFDEITIQITAPQDMSEENRRRVIVLCRELRGDVELPEKIGEMVPLELKPFVKINIT